MECFALDKINGFKPTTFLLVLLSIKNPFSSKALPNIEPTI